MIDNKWRTTVYSVHFEDPTTHKRTNLNVGACCLQSTMKLSNAHHEATVSRVDSDEACEVCNKVIERESDDEVEL